MVVQITAEFQAPTQEDYQSFSYSENMDYFTTALTFRPTHVPVFNIIILHCFLEDPA
jgi:hypothetical protein